MAFVTMVLFSLTFYLCLTDIEDLTHKTGNFKQFSIFVNMLESAIMKVSIHVN